MYLNTNFLKIFLAEELPEVKGESLTEKMSERGFCLILCKIISEYHLEKSRNNKQDHPKKIFFYDSVNKNYKAGDSDLVDYGHSREK